MANVTTLTSGQLHFSGLGNGTDFDSMITQLVKAESYRIKSLQNRRIEWEDKVAAFQDLNSTLLNLKSTITAFDTMNEFLVKAVSSSGAAVAATASSSAQVGTHQIQVGQLAKNAISVSSGFVATADASVTATNQTFGYTYAGGTPVTLNVAAGTTLTQLKDQINADPANPGVLATVVKVSETESRLQLSGKDLGQAKTISVTSSLDLLAGGFSATQAATDARFKIDGYPTAADAWLTRSSNSVSDALEGVTLTLKEVTTTPVTVSVSTDTAAIKENVRNFVEQVNIVRAKIQSLTKWDDKAKKGSILTGNYGVQMISSRLNSLTATKATGFDANQEPFSTLAQIGIKTDASQDSDTSGQLLLDETVLDEALAKNPDALAALFSAKDLGRTDNANFVYGSHIKSVTKAGTYDLAYDVDGAGNIVGATINGRAATINNTDKTITGVSGQDEAGLMVKVANLTAGSYTGKAMIKQGKVVDLNSALSTLTSATEGPLAVMEGSYNDVISNIDKQITNEQARIVSLERSLRLRFSKVDALLGYYDQLQSQIKSQVTSLSSGSK